MAKQKQYIYITQAVLEPAACKIGITDNLERRLKEYNSTTGKSKSNQHQYLFTCEVKDMRIVENDIKHKFSQMREMSNREIYFYNQTWFDIYIAFIKKHKLFKKEIFIKQDEQKKKVVIIKKNTPSLEMRGLTRENVITKAKKAKMMNFTHDMKT